VQLNANGQPRIAPGRRAEIGAANALITSVIGRAAGTDGPPHLFTTLARHPRLFRRWLRFAGALMPGGRLPRRDTELVILRVAVNCDCEYERRHHEHLGRRAGLDDADFARVGEGPAAAGWSEREAALLGAVDELHADRTISDALWSRLRERFTDAELIELCMLVGHYEMLAMTINGLRIQPDELNGGRPSALARIAERRR
jgi:alkylhydroperoxidase family enzyme